LRRLTPNGAGGLTIGPQIFITGQVQAAIPSVAIAANRTIGVFYYTCDNPNLVNPLLTAHFATSTNGGITFTDHVLSIFLSPEVPDPDPFDTQRVLGDFVQVKAVGNTFFGTYTGSRASFFVGPHGAVADPIFYKVSAQ
jgi:hypothetical protein